MPNLSGSLGYPIVNRIQPLTSFDYPIHGIRTISAGISYPIYAASGSQIIVSGTGSYLIITELHSSGTLSGSITVPRPAYLSGTLQVIHPASYLSGTLQVIPSYNSYLSGSLSVNPYADLPGSLSVYYPGLLSGSITTVLSDATYLSGSITVDRWTSDLSGSIVIDGAAASLSGSLTVTDTTQGFSDLSGDIIVIRGITTDLSGSLSVQPNSHISGSLITIRPSADLSGSITTLARFSNNISIDEVYTRDSLTINVNRFTPISGSSSLELIELEQTDSYTLGFYPLIRVTGTLETILLPSGDSNNFFPYGEETVEWSYPIQVTDNILTNNYYSRPTITEFDNRMYISYNQNYNNEMRRTYVVKSQPGPRTPQEKWIISDLYNNITDAQFVGPSGTMVQTFANGIMQHPGPQAEDANDFFESELTLVPQSYSPASNAVMYQNLWQTIQYQMQREGAISYPPPQWSFNPISEKIIAPTDPFNPIPQNSTFVSGTEGFYQDFNNSFVGSG
jgi:hypothetical protein